MVICCLSTSSPTDPLYLRPETSGPFAMNTNRCRRRHSRHWSTCMRPAVVMKVRHSAKTIGESGAARAALTRFMTAVESVS